MIKRLRTAAGLVFCLGIGLIGCASGEIPSESASVVETFGGPAPLSVGERACLTSRKELAKAVTANRNDNEEFQKAVFDSGKLAVAQQVLDCFGERWSKAVVAGVGGLDQDCAARVFVEIHQLAIDGGQSDLRVTETDTVAMSGVADACRT